MRRFNYGNRSQLFTPILNTTVFAKREMSFSNAAEGNFPKLMLFSKFTATAAFMICAFQMGRYLQKAYAYRMQLAQTYRMLEDFESTKPRWETLPDGRRIEMSEIVLPTCKEVSSDVLGRPPRFEIWDFSEFEVIPTPKAAGEKKFTASDGPIWYRPIKNKNPQDEITPESAAEKLKRYFDYKHSLPKSPEGLWTCNAEYIPPEKVSEYFAKIEQSKVKP